MSNDPMEPEDLATPEPEMDPQPEPAPAPMEESGPASVVTRAGVVWVATIAALLLLILLIVFIIQNQGAAEVHYFGLSGTIPLGIALLIAAVGGGLLVAVSGAIRIIQLRIIARRKASARRVSGKQSR